ARRRHRPGRGVCRGRHQRRARHRRRGVEQPPRHVRRDAARRARRQGDQRRPDAAAGTAGSADGDAARRRCVRPRRVDRLPRARQARRPHRGGSCERRNRALLRSRLAARPCGVARARDRCLRRRRACRRQPRANAHRCGCDRRARPRVAGSHRERTSMSIATTPLANVNADAAELEKFGALAHRWWDPASDMKPLHDINPLRVDWIDAVAGGLAGRTIVDVGCGGGILTEAMALRGARVTGIDLSPKAIGVAKLHRLESGVDVDYRLVAAEALAASSPGAFDVVTCMELLEHVPDPASTIAACATLAAPGGTVVFSTIARNPKSYLLAIVGAEYLLRLLPRGTHDWTRFINPSELMRDARRAGLEPTRVAGMRYNPLAKSYALADDVSVNYL